MDRSQDINPRACAKLIRPVAVLLGALALFAPVVVSAGTVEYDLTIALQEENFTGKPVRAMTINGQLPGPTLRFTEGDHAVIRVHNQMDMETSVHWHGILLPKDMDGVPFVTYPPIAPGETFTYEFDLRQSGTYWYHSHTRLQEQRGLFGSLVITPKDQGEFDHLRDHVVVLSDWTDEDADSVLHTLKRGGVVRFIMINRTMMHHPMHLHGHFFRVVNAQGDYARLKHTADVVPMSTTVIEFSVDDVEWKVVPTYNFYLYRFATVFAGADLEGAGDFFDKHEGVFGLRYLLPLNIASRVWVDTSGEFQFVVGQ